MALAMTVREASSVLGIGRNPIYEAVNRNEIPSFCIGETILIPRAGIERLLNSR